jgi:CubicO group peptidase (beta-lactamase class C family)
MTDTGHWLFHEPQPPRAMGYTKMTLTGQPLQEWRNNAFIVGPLASPAGGAYTTVGDMLRFSRALQSETLISRAMFDTMTEGRSDMGRGMKYGYLHGNMSRNGITALGHNGGGPGVSCDFLYFPDAGYTMVLLTNIDGGSRESSRFLKPKLFELAAHTAGL